MGNQQWGSCTRVCTGCPAAAALHMDTHKMQGLCTYACTKRGLSAGVGTPAHTTDPMPSKPQEGRSWGHRQPCGGECPGDKPHRAGDPHCPHNKDPKEGAGTGALCGAPISPAAHRNKALLLAAREPLVQEPWGASPPPQDSQQSSSWGRIRPHRGADALLPPSDVSRCAPSSP